MNEMVLEAPPPRLYSIGTLRYTLGGLAILFFVASLGDFAYNLMEPGHPQRPCRWTLHEIGAPQCDHWPGGWHAGQRDESAAESDHQLPQRPASRALGPAHSISRVCLRPLISLFLVILGFSKGIGLWISFPPAWPISRHFIRGRRPGRNLRFGRALSVCEHVRGFGLLLPLERCRPARCGWTAFTRCFGLSTPSRELLSIGMHCAMPTMIPRGDGFMSAWRRFTWSRFCSCAGA